GFEDTILVTRGAYGRWGGLTEDRIKHIVKTERADPLVDADLIHGIGERVDATGEVLRELDEAEVETALRYLVDEKGAEAIAVSLLWSFANPIHEQTIKKVAARVAPQAYCTRSSEIAPLPGEYERTSTAVINAYCGGITQSYLADLHSKLSATDYRGQTMVMQGYCEVGRA